MGYRQKLKEMGEGLVAIGETEPEGGRGRAMGYREEKLCQFLG
jgi:hypothetical protein